MVQGVEVTALVVVLEVVDVVIVGLVLVDIGVVVATAVVVVVVSVFLQMGDRSDRALPDSSLFQCKLWEYSWRVEHPPGICQIRPVHG